MHPAPATPAARPRAVDAGVLLTYLAAVAGREPAGGLFEIRHRRAGGGMGQEFIPIGRLTAAARAILRHGTHTDTYLGCAPRRRRAGDKAAIARAWTLWADCDTPAATARLRTFTPAPAIVIASGTPGHAHAYWPLAEPLAPAEAEEANRRLARALGADPGAVTNAAAILRPPATLSFKARPPTPVTIERLTRTTVAVCDVLAALPPPVAIAPAARRPERPATHRSVGDPLLDLTPAAYVEALTGRAVSRHGKAPCPLHEDRTPSLHCYPTPEQGWYCFGCHRGGTVYDLAAALWRLDTRGADFLELRRRLTERLLDP